MNEFTTPSGQSSTAGMDYVVLPVSGWLHNLYVYLAANQLAGGSEHKTIYKVGWQTSPDTPQSMGMPTPLRVTLGPCESLGTKTAFEDICVRINTAESFNLHSQRIGNAAISATHGWAAEYVTPTGAGILPTGGIGALTASTTWCGIYNAATQITDTGDEKDVLWVWPFSGTVRNMYVTLDSAQPAGGSLVMTLRTGANPGAMADTSLVLTVAAGAASGVYGNCADSVSVVAGELGSWRIVNNAAPTGSAAIRAIICEYLATGAPNRSMTGWSGQASWANETRYGAFFTSLAKSVTEIFTPCPRRFRLSNMRLWVEAPSGGAPSFDVTYTVRRNGADTGLTLTFDETASNAIISSGSTTVDVNEGDTLSVRVDSVVSSGNPEPRTMTAQIDPI